MSVLQLIWVSLVLAWIMLWLACLQLALNDGNGNTIQSSLQSTFYLWSEVYILLLVSRLPLICSLQSVVYPWQPAVYILPSACILALVQSLQSAFYEERCFKKVLMFHEWHLLRLMKGVFPKRLVSFIYYGTWALFKNTFLHTVIPSATHHQWALF